MDFMQYITGNEIILIVVLYIVGMIICNTKRISNRYIPFILLILGIAGAIGLMGINMDAVIQGILVTGTTVYTDQLYKQCKRKKDDIS